MSQHESPRQSYSRWFAEWPSTHERAGQSVEVIAYEAACDLVDVREALDSIDNYAARDLDHELHAIVQHYRAALGV